MDWFRVESNLDRHHKVARLRRRLGIDTTTAVGLVVRLWCYVASCRDTGALDGLDAVDLAFALDWPEERAEDLLSALVDSGFLVFDAPGQLRVHQWNDYQPLLRKRRSRASGQKQGRSSDVRRPSVPAEQCSAEWEPDGTNCETATAPVEPLGPRGSTGGPTAPRGATAAHDGAYRTGQDRTAGTNRSLGLEQDSGGGESTNAPNGASSDRHEAGPTPLPPGDLTERAAAKTPPKSLLLDLWSRYCPHLPQPKNWSRKRQAAWRQRCSENGFLDALEEAVRRVGASSFCAGENPRGWRANVDWFLRPDTWSRVLEGTYDDREPASREKPDPAAEISRKIARLRALRKRTNLETLRRDLDRQIQELEQALRKQVAATT